MSKVKYIYDYPQNREIAKGLKAGQLKEIAQLTGYSYTYIRMMFTGERKLKDDVMKYVRIIVHYNQERAEKLKSLN